MWGVIHDSWTVGFNGVGSEEDDVQWGKEEHDEDQAVDVVRDQEEEAEECCRTLIIDYCGDHHLSRHTMPACTTYLARLT